MRNFAKRKMTFLQHISFISISFIITSKCTILQKGKRLFCNIFYLLVYVSLLILVNAKSCKRKTTFLQDIPLISMCFIITSKCEILQKGQRLFCKIFHLLVYISLLILVNALCCKIFHIPYFSSLFLTGAIGIETTRVLFWKYSAVTGSSVQEQHQNRLYSVYCFDLFKTWGTTCSNEIFH